MNASIYNQRTSFIVPEVTPAVLTMPKVTFDAIDEGQCFLRVKDSRVEAFMKFGKRSALLLLNSKGKAGEVLKFKEANKVIPLDSEIRLSFSEMSDEGRAAQEVVRTDAQRVKNLTLPKAPKRVSAWAERRVSDAQAVVERIGNGETMGQRPQTSQFPTGSDMSRD